MKELLDQYLKQCYDIHNVQIPDKYIPYLLEFGKAVHNNAVDSCIENADLCLRKYNLQGEFTEENLGKEISSEREYEYFGINKQSLKKLKL